MFRSWATFRLSAAAVCLLILPVAPMLPAVVTLVLLAAVVIVLNVVEAAWVKRQATAALATESA
jgi:hypothetical protein